MKIEDYYGNEYFLPFKAFIPENVTDKPALIVHMHGVGERGNGGDELERVPRALFKKVRDAQKRQHQPPILCSQPQ